MIDEIENLLVDSEFIWLTLKEGDKISIEVNFVQDGVVQLLADKPYEVVAKTEAQTGNLSFVVESDITGALVNVHPFLVSDYITMSNPYRMN